MTGYVNVIGSMDSMQSPPLADFFMHQIQQYDKIPTLKVMMIMVQVMKNVHLILGLALMGWGVAATAAVTESNDGVDALAEEYLKQHPSTVIESEPVKKDPASGFWLCNGIRMHMGVDLTSWQDLDSGDMFVITEKAVVEDSEKEEKIKGTGYVYSWTKNPAVTKLFVIDKSGKNLYIRDDLKFFKTYKCKRN